ncbi:methyl-accepting chemotaxis protein [Pararhodobacter sp. CCB-MM2]|uniref:methyl-accepting chemotaxis protein n=1 Tax=Pararhodobacter sp. CCB-MM2 TaxID=1786003 RepID=UPI00082A0858|nr:methyl-accepting chemotaxis protein [Pararhodobacter sp. CCB-MM2]
MFKRLTQSRISLRLPALVVIALVFSIAASSSIYFLLFRSETSARAEGYARTVADHARNSFMTWLTTMHVTVGDLAEGHLAPDALRDFNEALALQAPGLLDDMRAAYLAGNPHEEGERDALDMGHSRPAYDGAHSRFHGFLRDHRERFGYADLILVNTAGDIIYSIEKNDDFGTNLNDGPYADSPLARAWYNALHAPAGTNGSSEVELYAATGAPASFIARRIHDHDLPSRPLIGTVIIELSNEAAAAALEGAGDLNAADTIYLMTGDGRARSDVISGLHEGGPIFSALDRLPDLPQTELAQALESGYLPEVEGIAGNIVNAAVVSFMAQGTPLAAIVEMDHGTAFAALNTFGQQAALFMALGIVLSLGIGYLVARSITKPLLAVSGSMEALAQEQYDDAVVGCDRHDEIGDLARGLEDFRHKLSAASEARALQAAAREEQEHVVEDLGRGLRDLASGHLDIRLDRPFGEGYEQLRADFNETVDTMENLMRSISANAAEIRSRAEEISASSDDLSHRTENQAATLEETAAALDELTASVRAAADSASEVERVVADARNEAEKSGQVVSEAVAAMSLIRKSSNEISQIIGVIDDIAFQTNLLALNAGVEAARAGDAGRGFAVVASEVRALAQRSSDAAKQIKTLINDSSDQVDTGVGLVGRAGETLSMIIERVGNIDTLVGEIATGAREQSSGLGEINVGVSQLDQVTQQNAAMVEEVTAAAVTLKHESKALTQVVVRFRLSDNPQTPSLPESAEVIDLPEPTPISAELPDLDAFDNVDETPDFPAAANAGRWQDF